MTGYIQGDSDTRPILRADPSTIHHKFIVGYQGWFSCPGDAADVLRSPDSEKTPEWTHWLKDGRPCTDLWPDTSAYPPEELFRVPDVSTKTNDPVFLFSSRNPATIRRHFYWMAQHGIDGTFLQRFVGQCDPSVPKVLQARNELAYAVKSAAEAEGRVFALMYDVSGVSPKQVHKLIEDDWERMSSIRASPSYLHEQGRPVVCLMGFGFAKKRYPPDLVRNIIQTLRKGSENDLYIMAGVPTCWRETTSASSDADPNPDFLDVWLHDVDALLPWTVGRHKTEVDVDSFYTHIVAGDLELIQKRNGKGKSRQVDYIPVVLPGASGYNMSQGRWSLNSVKRDGGHFLWRQIVHALNGGSIRTVYGATWDEYDEGTALLPAISKADQLPAIPGLRLLALDEDGYELPSDWYMRICGIAADALHRPDDESRNISERFPYESLQTYWEAHPTYLEEPPKLPVLGSIAAYNGLPGQKRRRPLPAPPQLPPKMYFVTS